MTIMKLDTSTIDASAALTWRGWAFRGTTALLIFLAACAPDLASAQIKPASSGEPSIQEPEMRAHGSGMFRPNKPHRRAGRSPRRTHQSSPNS